MNREQFLKRLELLLSDLPEGDARDAMDYYRNYFDEAGPDHEDEVIRELGSPDRVSATIHESVFASGAGQAGGRRKENGAGSPQDSARQSGGGSADHGRVPYPHEPRRRSRAPLVIALAVLAVCAIFLVAAVSLFVAGNVTYGVMKKNAAVSSSVGAEAAAGYHEDDDDFDDLFDLDDDHDEHSGYGESDSTHHTQGNSASGTAGSSSTDGSSASQNAAGGAADAGSGAASYFDTWYTCSMNEPVTCETAGGLEIELLDANLTIEEYDGTDIILTTDQSDRLQVRHNREDGDCLQVRETRGNAPQNLTLTLPAGYEFREFDMENGSGTVTISCSALSVNELSLNAGRGSIAADGQIISVESSVSAGTGSVTLASLASHEAELDVQGGNLTASRVEATDLSLECESGTLSASLSGTPEDYRAELAASRGGTIRYDGQDYTQVRLPGTNPVSSLEAECESGTLTVTFVS